MKLKLPIVFFLITCSSILANAQNKFFTKTGKIHFNCTGGIEKIEAINNSVTCVIDAQTGKMQFLVQMKGFEFEKALMQEHFNENYAESEKFPKALFSGSISNEKEINLSKDGTFPVKVVGVLNMHGQSKEIQANGTVTIMKGKVNIHSDFIITLSDFKILIPNVVKDKISSTVKISVHCQLDPLN